MTQTVYVASLAALSLAVVCISFTGIIRWLIRQHARERELLVNQLCHLSNRPWQEAPAYEVPPSDLDEELRLVTSPEQQPDW